MNEQNGHIDEQELWFSAVSPEELAKYDKEKAFALFQQRVAESKKQPKARQARLGWLRYAAVVVALVAVGYFSFKGGQSHVESALGDIVVEAPQGSRTQMALPDGTKVWLNAGSKISYSQGFSIVNRLVMLVGEGYFEVARNEQLPFRVVSEDLQVSVLGTKFNFRDYPTDTEATVALLEGKVQLANMKQPGEPVVLDPNQRAVLDKQSGSISVADYETDNARQWTKGNLLYEGETLAEIVKDLSRSYNVEITVADASLYRLRFHGEFIRQEQTLREVLDALSATGKIRYEMNGRNVRIY